MLVGYTTWLNEMPESYNSWYKREITRNCEGIESNYVQCVYYKTFKNEEIGSVSLCWDHEMLEINLINGDVFIADQIIQWPDFVKEFDLENQDKINQQEKLKAEYKETHQYVPWIDMV